MKNIFFIFIFYAVTLLSGVPLRAESVLARIDIIGTKSSAGFGEIIASPGIIINSSKSNETVFHLPGGSDNWLEGTISFIPNNDGEIRIFLDGQWNKDKEIEKKSRILFDDISINGAIIENGDFETVGNWKFEPFPEKEYASAYIKNSAAAHNGSSCVVTQHGSRIWQKINVKAGSKIKINFWYKKFPSLPAAGAASYGTITNNQKEYRLKPLEYQIIKASGILIDGDGRDFGKTDGVHQWYEPEYMTIKENNGKIIARITLQADNDFFYLYAEITDSDLLPPGRDISRSDSLLLYFFHPDANNNGLADGDIQIQILPGDGVKIKSAVHISVITSGKATELDAVNCQSAGRKAVFYSAAGQSGSAGWQVEAKIPVKPLLSLINQNTRAVYFNFATADLRANDFRILYACGAIEHNNISRNFIKGILFQSAVFLAENNTPNKNINLPIDLGSGAENLLIPDIYLPEKLKGKSIRIFDMSLALTSNNTRNSLCLNGIWGVLGFETGFPEKLDNAKWDYAAVPLDPQFQITKTWPFFKNRNSELCPESYTEYLQKQNTRAYDRKFILPATWKGKRIFLDIAESGTVSKCTVYVNGKFISGKNNTDRQIEITAALKFDTDNRLTIIAESASPAVIAKIKVLNTGDIWLHCLASAGIESCFIKTSVQKKEIVIDCNLLPGSSADGITAGADIYDARTGLKTFSLPAKDLKAVSIDNTQKKIRLSGTWENPGLWSFEIPVLHTARIFLKDAGGRIIDEYRQNFGFREVKIEGKNILINNIPVHLKAVQANFMYGTGYYKLAKEKGINCIVYFGYQNPEYLMNLADELGLYMIAHVGPFYTGANFGSHDRSPERLRWLERHFNHPSVIIWAGNLSTVGPEGGWTRFNFHTLGTGYFPQNNENGKFAMEQNRLTREWIAGTDDTRIIINYCAGACDPAETVMNHPDFGIPLQEAGGVAEAWSKTVNAKPYILLETWGEAGSGKNLDLSFGMKYSRIWEPKRFDSREGADNNLIIEEASQYIGELAYQWAEPVRTFIPSNWELLVTMGPWDRDESELYGKNKNWLIEKKNMAEIALDALGYKENARACRGYGLTGRNWFSDKILQGFEHKVLPGEMAASNQPPNTFEGWYEPMNNIIFREKRYLKYSISHPVFKSDIPSTAFGAEDLSVTERQDIPFTGYFQDALNPLLIWIGGGPAGSEFRNKDHSYTSEERVEKNIIKVNDYEHSVSLDIGWMLVTTDGKIMESGKIPAEAGAGEVIMSPLSFVAPGVSEKSRFKLLLEAADKKTFKKLKDEFNITVFPKEKISSNLSVCCYDPEGMTGLLLKRIGVSVQPVLVHDEIPEAKILIIGRNALNSWLAGRDNFLGEKIRTGLRVLIMEQNADSVMGPMQKEIRLRSLFIKNYAHPALRNFDDRDFSHWRGSATLTEAYPEWEKASEYMSYKEYQEFGKWGNEGIVCTLPIKRPQHGNARTLLAGGFDQEWAGAAEYHYGQGVLIICQLDICGRTIADPAADRLLSEFLRYLKDFTPVQYKSAVYAGKPENSSFLKRMQVRITDLPENAGVLIVDASENELDKKKKWLNDFVIRQGKTMLVLWPDENSDLSWLPGKIMAGKALERKEKIFKVILSAEEKQNKLLNGITSEDMYFKFFRDEIPLIRKAGSGKIMLSGLLAEIPAGQGKIIICQLNPDQHENERSFGKVYRFWANLFTSLSVALDSRLNLYWNGLEISQREWLFEIDPENAGIKTEWFQPAFNDNNWKRLKTGKSWESQGITSENPALPGPPHTSYNGNAWYRLHLDIPEKYLKSDLYLEIGAIAGEDTVWLNGSLIGTTSKKTAGSKNYYQAFRNYKIPSGLLRGKNNVIAVCVYNEGGFGGLTKWPVRISPADQPYDTVLFPLEKNRKQGDPYRYVMW